MNKLLYPLLVLFFLSSGCLLAQSAKIDLGLFRKSASGNMLDVRLRSSADVVDGAYSAGIFTVRFPSNYGVTLHVLPNTVMYNYAFLGPVGRSEGYDYYRFQFSGVVNKVNWEKGKEYPLMTLQVDGKIPPKARFELVTGTFWTKENNSDFYQELNGGEMQHRFYQLPMKLRSFNANGQAEQRTVKLDWEYESEVDLAYSEVEYSADGLSFASIGTTAPHNEMDRNGSAYVFFHVKPQAGLNYYRIRMVDINGGVEYSEVRSINFDDLDTDFSAFPNPTNGPLILVSRNLGKYTEGVYCQLVDNAGKVVMSNIVKDHNMTFDLSKIPAGVYYLQVMTGKEQLDKFQIVVAN